MPTSSPPCVVVLGGLGLMGRLCVRDLVETCRSDEQIIVADQSLEAVQAQVQQYQRVAGSPVAAAAVNITDVAATTALLQRASVVINATPYRFNLQVMQAALAAQVHYIDLGGLFHMTRQQLEWHEAFAAIGKTAILGMGAAPGISNVLARYGAAQLHSVREIHIRVASIDHTIYQPTPLFPISYSLATILEELSAPPAVYTSGQFEFLEPLSGQVTLNFPRPIGRQRPLYTLHSEVATLPLSFAEQGIQEVSFKIALDPLLVERVEFLRQLGLTSAQPLAVGDGMIRPIDVLEQLIAQQPVTAVKGPLDQYEIIRVILKGSVPLEGKGMEKVTVCVDCHVPGVPEWGIGLDVDTGSPPAIVAQMLMRKELDHPGVAPPEVAIDPVPFLSALRQRHITIKVTKQKGWTMTV